MILYILYRIGLFLALTLPIRVSYALACVLADIFYYISRRDRRAVINNLTMVLGPSAGDRAIAMMAKDVFRNFAKYLIDFFRSQKIDKDYLKQNVKVEGSGNIDDALAMGKGVIMLSGHIGNWELGAFVTSMIGYPINAVVLTHKNKRINDFFTSQRLMGNMKPIELGASLKSCYRALRNNELLALLGDRDFTKNGISVDFFGKRTMMPKGPATFSYRLGSPIVPAFLVREPDNTFRYFMEKPIISAPGLDEETAVRELTARCSSAIEACVKKYPTQWFVFRNMWNNDDKESLRPDTII
ncbi:MAG: lysophospholipid acyltransferase family protein [Candidatus Omnitrophica bacterium]|nr:lysophospholipid acyltransferase family protein [Candidatus Omnitrophota bacterium]